MERLYLPLCAPNVWVKTNRAAVGAYHRDNHTNSTMPLICLGLTTAGVVQARSRIRGFPIRKTNGLVLRGANAVKGVQDGKGRAMGKPIRFFNNSSVRGSTV